MLGSKRLSRHGLLANLGLVLAASALSTIAGPVHPPASNAASIRRRRQLTDHRDPRADEIAEWNAAVDAKKAARRDARALRRRG